MGVHTLRRADERNASHGRACLRGEWRVDDTAGDGVADARQGVLRRRQRSVSDVFSFEYPVPYGAVDYARIVYYPQFLHFCHITMERMFDEVVGVAYATALTQEKVGYPTVKSEAAFERPVPLGEVLRLSMQVEHLGTSSVRFRYEGHRASDGELAFRVRNVQVAVDMDAWKSTPIPAHHRKAFETLRSESASDA